MAFIRRRVRKTGAVSTALIESYRGSNGRKPRHRLIANLRGAETLTVALGRLAAERDKLRKERDGLDLAGAETFYAVFTQQTMAGRVWTADERKDIDRLLRVRRRSLERAGEIDALTPNLPVRLGQHPPTKFLCRALRCNQHIVNRRLREFPRDGGKS